MSVARFPSLVVAWFHARPAARVILVFALSLGLLLLLVPPPPLAEDTARDLLLARDCVDAGLCGMAGPRASFGGFTQGAIWIHLLELCRFLGLGLRGARGFVLFLDALSAALLYAAPRRLCGWAAGPAAGAIYLLVSGYCIELPILWNPSMLPLPLAIFYLCLSSLAFGGELQAAVAAGVALALSFDAHLVCAALVPFFLGAVVATARRPLFAAPLAVLAMAASSYASSRGAWVADLPLLLGAKLLCGAALGAILLLGVSLRARAKLASPITRARATLVGACVYYGVVVVALRLVTGHPLAPRYFAAVVPAAAILGGAILSGALRERKIPEVRPGRANGLVVVVGALIVALLGRLPSRATDAGWTALEVETLASSLYAEGWRYRDLELHLRGPDAHALLAALAPYGPGAAAPHAPSSISDDLVVAKVSRARLPGEIPSEWRLIDMGREWVAVTRRASSWLSLAELETCERTSSRTPQHCEPVNLVADADAQAATGTFASRAYPSLDPRRGGFTSGDDGPPAPFHWSVAVKVHAEDETRVLSVVEPRLPWRIEHLDGVRRRGSVPGGEVTLGGPGEGSVVFGIDVPPQAVEGFRRWLPSFIETRADETALRALLVGP
jgi:hypothetical protein